jgi:hypothetical protein
MPQGGGDDAGIDTGAIPAWFRRWTGKSRRREEPHLAGAT